MIARPARPVSGSRSSCSVARQETTFAADAARMKAPWMSAQNHGFAGAGPLRVDRVRHERAEHAVVQDDEADGDEERQPVLVEDQQRDDDEEVEVRPRSGRPRSG